MNDPMNDRLVGIPIEAEETVLRREAQKLHEAWLADGGSKEKKHQFAVALRAWGKATGKRGAVAQADKLQQED